MLDFSEFWIGGRYGCMFRQENKIVGCGFSFCKYGGKWDGRISWGEPKSLVFPEKGLNIQWVAHSQKRSWNTAEQKPHASQSLLVLQEKGALSLTLTVCHSVYWASCSRCRPELSQEPLVQVRTHLAATGADRLVTYPNASLLPHRTWKVFKPLSHGDSRALWGRLYPPLQIPKGESWLDLSHPFSNFWFQDIKNWGPLKSFCLCVILTNITVSEIKSDN